VTIGVGVGFAGFVAGWALRSGIEASFARMGADLLVVPRGALVNITASLLTVQPTDETLDAGLAAALVAVAGVARAAPQRIVPSLVDGHAANLIAFDPALDFSVTTWLDERQPGPLGPDGVIAGSHVEGRVGQTVPVCGKPLTVYGRLGETAVGPFDDSYFFSFDALAALVSFCREAKPATAHGDGKACSPDLPPNRVSAFLLQLAPGAKAQDVRFALARLPEIRVVEGNAVLTSSRQTLGTLLLGIAVFGALQLAALAILVSLLFSAIVQERRREIGLLRAMGARPGQVTAMILTEAAIVTGLGGLAGLVLGSAALLAFARSLGFYFGLLGIAFSWPPATVLEVAAVLALLFSAALGIVGALVPAWRVRRVPPDALIGAGER
jgi:putative ABC transport system permease protein